MADKQTKAAWEKTLQYTTPVGTIVWSSLFQAQASLDANYGPTYNVTLELEHEDAEALVAKVNKDAKALYELLKKEKPKAVFIPYSIDANAKGQIAIYPSKKATYKDGNPTPTPPVYDAEINPIKDAIRIGKGTKAAVSIEMNTKFKESVFKVTAPTLRAVQIVELVEYAGGSGKQIDASNEFEKVEGYTITDTAQSEGNDDDGSF